MIYGGLSDEEYEASRPHGGLVRPNFLGVNGDIYTRPVGSEKWIRQGLIDVSLPPMMKIEFTGTTISETMRGYLLSPDLYAGESIVASPSPMSE